MCGEVHHRNIQLCLSVSRRGRADTALVYEDFARVGVEACSVFIIRTDQAANSIDFGFSQAKLGRDLFKCRAYIGIGAHCA
ncbi:hypothetical protein D3C71_701800 [compost metagenome]